ncbi:MAG: hypothetical protein WD872_06155 [Pirellulaceae bacterium]
MIRTTLSFCALFGSLILASKWLQESSSPAPAGAPALTAPALTAQEREALESAPVSAEPPSHSPAREKLTRRPTRRAAVARPAVHQVAYEEDLSEKLGDTYEDSADEAARLPLDTNPFEISEEDELARLATKPSEKTDSSDDSAAEAELAKDKQSDEKKSADKPAAKSEFKPDESKAVESKTDEAKTEESKTDEPKPLDLEKLLKDDATTEPAEPELTPELVELRGRLRSCLAYYYFRPENVATRSPWGSMHWMIAYGVDAQLIVGPKRVNAIGYLNYNGVCNGQSLFYVSNNRLHARIGPGVQGHAGQYLSMLAQSRVKADYPMLVDGRQFTVADLIVHEQETCRPASELTFKLIALSHYLKSDQKWRSNDGQAWDIPRLIKEELAQPINGAACGGSHRLNGFSYAVRKREQRKEPIEGQWLRAKKYIEDFHDYTFKLQNPDGSFSTEWFVTRADFGDVGRRLQTTGHIAEWLSFSLDKEELTDPRMVKSIGYLTDLLLENRGERWSIGPLGHGLHALAIYDERVFGGQPGAREEQLVEVRRQQLKR